MKMTQQKTKPIERTEFTYQERLFVIEYVNAKGDLRKACRLSGMPASTLEIPHVKEAIEHKVKKLESELEITAKWKIEKIREIIELNCYDRPELALTAIAELNKMQGDYAPTKTETKNLNANVCLEIKEQIAQYEKEY